MMKATVVSLENKNVGELELDEDIFGIPVRSDILHRAVNWHLANKRSGNHKTKQRAEVKGTTAKPFRQKGTGRARQGDSKAPHMRGGGVAFGPVVRSHSYKFPKKMRRLALKIALSEKQANGNLVVLDEAVSKTGKTADLRKQLEKLGWNSTLLIDGIEVNDKFFKAANNIKDLDVIPQIGANTYDILRRETLVLTKEAISRLQERLK